MTDAEATEYGPVDLVDLVRAHVPSVGMRSHAIALDVLDAGSPGWHRDEFSPGHFTASGFVVSPDGEALLLIHHPRVKRWLQPGGHIEAFDGTVEAAARREVAEETGSESLDRIGEGLLRIDVHAIPRRHAEPEHVHIDLAVGFLARTDRIGPIDEVLDAAWVAFDDLDRFDVDDAVTAAARAVRLAVRHRTEV